jgi:hypothetical protein
MTTIISQIQQDQAKRQTQVNWRNDQSAIAMLKAVADANCKADRVKKR